MTDDTQPAKRPGGITGKGFQKGDDPKRYRGGGKGRGTYTALRDELVALLNEPARNKAGEPILGPNGKQMTQREAGLRRAIADPKQFLQVLEISVGGFPKQVELTGEDGGPMEIVIRYADDAA